LNQIKISPNNKNLKICKRSTRISTVANNNKAKITTAAVFPQPFSRTSFISESTFGAAGSFSG
jgi:hypothetical protein